MAIEISRMPSTLQEILIRLKYIGGIKRGVKLNIQNLSYSDSSWFETIRRSLSGEGRAHTQEFLKNVVSSSLDIINDYKDSEFIETILEHLSNTVVGLENLRETYRMDPEFECRVSTIIENVNFQLDKNKHFLKGRKKKIKLENISKEE